MRELMAKISTDQIKKIRKETGAGVMATKRALEASGGDEGKAKEILFKEGVLNASKKEDREATEGAIIAYVHDGGKVASMVQLQCETDFVASSKDFHELGRDIAMQVAAMNPEFIDRDSAEKDTSSESILLEQKFIKDGSITIEQRVKELISRVGENIKVRRFERFCV